MHLPHRSRSRPAAAAAIGATAVALALTAAGSAAADAPAAGSAAADAPASRSAAEAPKPRLSMLVDGRLYAAQQMSRFKHKRLFMVAGRRDRARGHAVAFTKRRDWVAYLRRQAAPQARASAGSWITIHERPYLQGDALTLDQHEPNLGNRRRGWFWSSTFNDAVSSVETGDTGVLLFADTWYRGSMLYVRPQVPTELWQYGFDNVASSVCIPRFPAYGCG